MDRTLEHVSNMLLLPFGLSFPVFSVLIMGIRDKSRVRKAERNKNNNFCICSFKFKLGYGIHSYKTKALSCIARPYMVALSYKGNHAIYKLKGWICKSMKINTII